MSTTPNYAHGTFTWREVMTTDVAASKRFYGEVLGWSFEDMPMGTTTYTMIKNQGVAIGGMAPLDASRTVPSHWIGTVSVADTDAAARLALEAGGQVAVPPGDIEGYGRFAVVIDPLGAPISLMHSFNGDPRVALRPGPGEFCWEHLDTTDPAASKAFFHKLFGWEVTSMPGGMEVFCVGEREVASLSPAPAGAPTRWLPYVTVEQLASARARVTSQGGRVISEESPIPGIGAFSLVSDNLGASFCLFQRQR